MTKTKSTLLASSPTVEGIAKCINCYFCSDSYFVDPIDLAIHHRKGDAGKNLFAFRVRLYRGRYRFESVS